jgi:hypothetical protein
MTAVERGNAGEGSALVSQPDDERRHFAPLNEVVEQAKLEMSARYGFLVDEAFEVLSGLARSLRCSVVDLADSVVKSGGRLDGNLRGDSGSSLLSTQNESGGASFSPELLIDAPSARSAFVLAGWLAEYGGRAVVERGAWQVVVDRCSSFEEGAPEALSRTRRWLGECGMATTWVTLNGETYLLDGSPARSARKGS